jgi:hypothetical protein
LPPPTPATTSVFDANYIKEMIALKKYLIEEKKYLKGEQKLLLEHLKKTEQKEKAGTTIQTNVVSSTTAGTSKGKENLLK